MKYTYKKIDNEWIVFVDNEPKMKFPSKERASQFCKSMNRSIKSKDKDIDESEQYREEQKRDEERIAVEGEAISLGGFE